MNETSKPIRRWYQFRLRALLIAVLVLSLPLSWFAVKMEKARKQKEAVEAIHDFGGTTYYHLPRLARTPMEFVELPRTPPITPRQPGMLRAFLGNDFFDDVVMVDLGARNIADSGLEHLKGLTNLEILSLEHTPVSDAGLEHLKGLAKLGELYLNDTQVTLEGIRMLEEALPNCKIEY